MLNSTARQNTAPRTVLVVEDEPTLATAIAQRITAEGWTARVAGDGASAVQAALQLKPDLVIMDITMPNMDGLEALKAIRGKNGSANVVMCSAMGQESMVMDAVRSGAKDFIVKPFKPDRVLKTVNTILGG